MMSERSTMKSIAERIPNFTLYTPHARPASRLPKNGGLAVCAPKKECRITLTLCDMFTGFRGLACLFSSRYLVVFVSHNSQTARGGRGGRQKVSSTAPLPEAGLLEYSPNFLKNG
jgi:hypothetical protein